MLHRRLARDYETLPAPSGAVIHLAMTDLMAHRLTNENTISWRTPAKPHRPRILGWNNGRQRPVNALSPPRPWPSQSGRPPYARRTGS
ncbi:hypothetical protein Srubr_27790 [Streptomyces rubradiris]|uniref:Transposase n=1 Tax=Streptomyces rubradiris TaxID=285531 RepID=A0ABQ3RAP9_STRRR|nr:hypothetical protein GCM10018792_50670 [Streptomyces rubradiris]GHI52933.1 hypothetical protein Srubr_27790 [Streptomyces rubradiris]